MLDKLKSKINNLFTFKGGVDTALKICIIVVIIMFILKIISPIIVFAMYVAEVLLGLAFIALIVVLCVYLFKKFVNKK